MKALSLKQPWAHFIATGQKTIETRTWKTIYRGPLLIVSSLTPDRNYYPYFAPMPTDLPLGRAVAIVELVDCRPMRKEDEEKALIPYLPERYAWIFENIRRIKPFPVKGKLRIYEVEMPEKK